MSARIDEIDEGIYRLSVWVPDIAPPQGFTFNSFLIVDDEPLLFHAGQRSMFAAFREAVGSIIPLDTLRWISFGHVEADECGAMNLWLEAAPRSEIVHGATACSVSLNDLADRPPRAVADGELVTSGRRRIRYYDTPHVPHGWEAGLIHEETSGILFCGDLFTQLGAEPFADADLVAPAIAAEEMFHGTSVGPKTAPTLRRLAGLAPSGLALMHGPTYRGDAAGALEALADYYDRTLADALRAQAAPAVAAVEA